jgi:hypothetical protein
MSSDPKRMLKQEKEAPLPSNPQVQWLFQLLRNDTIQCLRQIIKVQSEIDGVGSCE